MFQLLQATEAQTQQSLQSINISKTKIQLYQTTRAQVKVKVLKVLLLHYLVTKSLAQHLLSISIPLQEASTVLQ